MRRKKTAAHFCCDIFIAARFLSGGAALDEHGAVVGAEGSGLLARQQLEHLFGAADGEVVDADVDGGDDAGHAHHLLDVVVADEAEVGARFQPARAQRFQRHEGDDVVEAEDAVHPARDDGADDVGKFRFPRVKHVIGQKFRAPLPQRRGKAVLAVEADFDVVPAADIGEFFVAAGEEMFARQPAAVFLVGIDAAHAVGRAVSAEDDEGNARVFDKFDHVCRRFQKGEDAVRLARHDAAHQLVVDVRRPAVVGEHDGIIPLLFKAAGDDVCGEGVKGIDQIVKDDGDGVGGTAAKAGGVHVHDVAQLFAGGVDLFFHLFGVIRLFVEHARDGVDGQPRARGDVF